MCLGTTTMPFDNLAEKLEAAREGTTTSSGGDNEDLPRVKMTPDVAIRGTLVDAGFFGDTSIEQNIRGNNDWREEGDFVLTLEDPEVFQGTLFEAAGRNDAEDSLAQNMDEPALPNERVPSRSFRAVPSDWEQTSHIGAKYTKINGKPRDIGISVFGSDFIGEETTFAHALDEYDRVEVIQGSKAGQRMAQSIDATQSLSAYVDDNGDVVNGLLEYPDAFGSEVYDPTSEGGNFTRGARQPQIHPQLDGEEVVLFLHFDGSSLGEDDVEEDEGGNADYRTHYGKVFADLDGETVNLTEADEPLPVRDDVVDDGASFVVWDEPDFGGSGSGSGTDTQETETIETAADGGGLSFDALDSNSGSDGVEYGSLDTVTQQFVDRVVTICEGVGDVDETMDDFDAKVEQSVNNGDIGDYEADELRTVINGRL